MHTKLMGILNVTPDSSFDKGSHFAFDKSISRAQQIVNEGADIIDIGGESTRPGAEPVSLEEELRRVIPVVKEIHHCLNIPISVDTMKWQVAEAAINAGATFINDVSGFGDSNMQALAADAKVEICVMHMQNDPRTMQAAPHYEEGIIPHLMCWFKERIQQLLDAGISPAKIYVDPGIGFGKTVDHNLEIVHNLAELKKLGFPLLLGLSRKSFMGKINNKTYEELLPETIAIHTIACLKGVNMLRVHDVKDNKSIIHLVKTYMDHSPPPG